MIAFVHLETHAKNDDLCTTYVKKKQHSLTFYRKNNIRLRDVRTLWPNIMYEQWAHVDYYLVTVAVLFWELNFFYIKRNNCILYKSGNASGPSVLIIITISVMLSVSFFNSILKGHLKRGDLTRSKTHWCTSACTCISE